MSNFKVEKSDFVVPPEDSYFLDLVWIEQLEGKNGPYYRWHWKMSDIPEQKELVRARATSQTSLVPTLNNRFGMFLDILSGGLEEGQAGSTEGIVAKKYRVKAFIEHNKVGENTFCNVTKLITGTSKAGEGIGYKGVTEKLKEQVNEVLAKAGKEQLEVKEPKEPKESKDEASPVKSSKTADIPW